MKKVYTALVTPFKNDKIDYLSLERLLQLQILNGIHGFVIAGTTGEGSNLKSSEKKEMFSWIKKNVPSNTPLLVGTGSSSHLQTLQASLTAQSWGADAVLVVVPPYVKPPQRGLVQHFSSLAKNLDIPLYLYNVPSRTITSLEPESIYKLSSVPGIVGIKEASGDLQFLKKLKARINNKKFIYLSGDDLTYEGFLAAGGDGIISVASHLLPQQFVAGKISKYEKLIKYLFVEANPIPIKMALYLKGILQTPDLRLPLTSLDPKYVPQLKKLLKEIK